MEETIKQEQPPVQETPKVEENPVIGFADNPNFYAKLSIRELRVIKEALTPFEWVSSIVNTQLKKAQEEGGIKPILKSDEKFLIKAKDEAGNDVVQISPEFWDKDKKPKSMIITDVS